jgi:hypothetical protein
MGEGSGVRGEGQGVEGPPKVWGFVLRPSYISSLRSWV